MQIQVEFWGLMSRLAGSTTQPLDLPEPATVADAIAALQARPEFAQELARCAYAIGDEMVNAEHDLRAGDSLAVLPPVSGG